MGKIFSLDFLIESIPDILQGIPYTLLIAVVAFLAGLVIGFIGALCKIYRLPVLRQVTGIYVSFVRGTPLIVQIMLIYYAVPVFIRILNLNFGTGIDISWVPAIVFVLIAFSLNAGAYLTESIRAMILSIDKSQMEAAYSVGMSTGQAMRRIILPQAAAMGLPVLTNFFIGLMKDTSLAFVAAVPEIMGQAKIVAGRASRFFEAYIVAALLYWLICLVLERSVALLEKKQGRSREVKTP